jgi:hypothetical protein
MTNPFPYHERFEATQKHFRRQLAVLEEALPAAHEAVRPTLMEIRRTALDLQMRLQAIDVPVPLAAALVGTMSCFDCGKRNLEVFHTSKQGGYHLCSPCFHHRVSVGQAHGAH